MIAQMKTECCNRAMKSNPFYLKNLILTKLVFLFILLSNTESYGVVNPDIEWNTLSTPHFEVIYDAKQYQTAKKYALRLELNHKLLSSYFESTPEKTIVIINDNTDLANGYATPIPYQHIMLYPVLPTAHDSISEYGDWPQELTLHEYTHILNFQPVRSFMKAFRSALGSIVSPTLLLPRWWHEGIAVEMETRFSSRGRLRSIYQDATFRALVKAQQLDRYSVADINESELDSWPRGARPYLFGSILLSEILHQQGGTYGNTLLQSFSGRIPYFINGPLEDDTEKKFHQWFEQALQNINNLSANQLKQIRQSPAIESTPLEEKYLESHSPQLSPNGNILTFVAKNTWGKSSIQIFDRQSNERAFDLKADSLSEFLSIESKTTENPKEGPPPGNINKISWLPDSSGFIFDQIRFIDSYSNYSDLFFYDLKLKKNRRITTGKRLRDAAISPDSKQIAAVQLNQSNTSIVTLDLEGNNIQSLYIPSDFHKVANPLFIDNEQLLFTERDLNGDIQLYKINLQTKIIESLYVDNLSQIDALNLEPKGISFVAVENGVRNLYFTDNEFSSYKRLSHTETAIFDGCIDPRTQSVYTTIMSEKGLQVHRQLQPEQELPPPPLVTHTQQHKYETHSFSMPTESDLESEFGSSLSEPQSYSSTQYLMPRYWLPFFYVSESGFGTQVSTAAFDPLEKHMYSAQVGYDSYSKESNAELGYANNSFHWPFTATYSRQTRIQPYLNFEYNADQINLMTTHDLRPWSENMTFGLGLEGLATQPKVSTSSTVTKRIGPQAVYIYDGAGKSIYSKIPFSGYQFLLYGTHYVKTAEALPLTRGIAKASYFHSRFLPERHIISLQAMAQEMKGSPTQIDLTTSDIYPFAQSMILPRFVLRGYESGYFYFKKARSFTFEYHLPLWGHWGWRTFPAFLKRTHLNIYSDVLSAEGVALNLKEKVYNNTHLNKAYMSYGLELKGDMTFGYYLPLTVFIGLYHRPEYSDTNNKWTTFFGVQM